jgi:predicted amidohydrolase
MVRVVALQFAASTDVAENLATCLRMIDEAARLHEPRLMVLPEFVNHPAFYDDREHALSVALELDSEFLQTIAARAAQHRAHIVVHVSLRRGERITATSILYDDNGERLAETDKQTLLEHEALYLSPASEPAHVVDTKLGRLGLLSCREGSSMEGARCLSLRGAQVICQSLGAMGADEVDLHVPARAAENHVFVVAANKIGALVPAHLSEGQGEALRLPESLLRACGESQVVGCDGSVLSRASRDEEAIVAVDIDPARADHKFLPDGSERFVLRRHELYRPITSRPRSDECESSADSIDVALFSQVDADGTFDESLRVTAEAVRALALDGADLVVLPELFYLSQGRVEHPAAAGELFLTVVRRLAEACADTKTHVVTSAVERIGPELFHMGILVGGRGIVARQAQLHVPLRHAWATPGRRYDTFKLPWGRLAIAVGEDLSIPELAKVYALSGAHVIASPHAPQEAWELQLAAPARAAENRVCVAVATREQPHASSALFDLTRDFTLGEPWRERVFDGRLNEPRVTRCLEGQALLRGPLALSAARNKRLFRGVHLLVSRPWSLASDLTRRNSVVREEAQVSEPTVAEAEPENREESSDGSQGESERERENESQGELERENERQGESESETQRENEREPDAT